MTQITTIFTVDSDTMYFVYLPQISPNNFGFYFLTTRLTHKVQTLLKASKQSVKNKNKYTNYKQR